MTSDIYIGYTPDLRIRITKHNSNKVFSTKNKGLWDLIYYEAYLSKDDAILRERQLKHHAKAPGQLKRRINPTPFIPIYPDGSG
ncbi:MAG: GIY-YIG nuclease family protein [Patescibacteria group bacterium]